MNLGFETEYVEYKKTTGELKAAMISVCSMLNKHGEGTVYFGVKDDGEVIGQQIGHKTLRDVSQAVADAIKPQIIPTVSYELIDDLDVIKLSIKGTDTPYSAYGRYYMRSADEDRELSPDQLVSLLRRKKDDDPIIRMDSSKQDLTFSQLKLMFELKGVPFNEDTLVDNLGLINKDGKYNYMAELLSDKNDVSIKVASFRGTDKSDLIKRNEYGFKCLLLAMELVLLHIEAINDTYVKIDGRASREEEQLFDRDCFREAWINACLHNSWEEKNPPAVYIFSDRIEIISTGSLPAGLSEEEFYMGISKPVNKSLQKIFGQLDYIEQTGHGVPLIVGKYGRQAFDISTNFITVIIPLKKPENEENRREISDAILNSAQRAVLNILDRNPRYTIKDLVKTTGYSDGYVRKLLDQLKEKGLLIRQGAKKNGSWRVVNAPSKKVYYEIEEQYPLVAEDQKE